MKAILVTPGRSDSVRLAEVEEPAPWSSQALLKVLELGIDGTDLDINAGTYGEAPTGSDYLIAGHECLAVVKEMRAEAEGITAGDLVVPTVRRPDDCINCAGGESDMCLTGNYKEHGIKGLHGFAGEYGVSDTQFLVRVPKQLAESVVLLEPMSVAEKGVFQAYKMQERMIWRPKRALVLGAGPLGLLTTYLLRCRGMEVHAVATRSADSPKARLVQRVGATYVNSTEQPTNTLGRFDLIMEETGVPSVAMEALHLLNTNGIICFLGIYPHAQLFEDVGALYTDMVLGNKTFFGSVNANKRYFEMGAKDFAVIEERFPGVLRDTITKVVPPSDYLKAYRPSRDDIKTVISFR